MSQIFGHQTQISNPSELAANTEDYLILLNVAFNRKIYSQVAHMGHIAVELAIKAAFAKKFNGSHPYGHDLPLICSFDFRTGTFYDEITKDNTILEYYVSINTAWEMQYRYIKRKVDKPTAIMYKVAYRELTKWILKNYV